MILPHAPIVAAVPVLVAHVLVRILVPMMHGVQLESTESARVAADDGIETGAGHVVDVLHPRGFGVSVETVEEQTEGDGGDGDADG